MKKIMFGILFLAVIMISSCTPEMSPESKSLQLDIPSSSSGSIEGLSTCYTAHGIRVDSQNSGGHSGSSWEFYSNRDINDDGTIRGNEFCRYENLHLTGNSGECVFGYVNIYDPATDMKTSAIYPCHDGLTMEELVLPGEGSLSYNAVCCV